MDHDADVDKRAALEDTGCHQNAIPDRSTPSIVSMISLACHQVQKNWKVIALGQCLSFLLASTGAAQATLHLSCGLSAPTFTMALVYLGLSIIHLPILVHQRQSTISFGGFCRRRRAGQRLSMHDSDAVSHPFGEERNQASDENNPHGTAKSSEIGTSDSANKPLSRSLWWYLLLAFFDVQANTVTNLAFRYTTLTSVTLFDALAIPAAMVISRWIVFRSSRRYHPLHYVGVLVCMVGVVLNVFQDYESDSDPNADEMDTEYPHKMWGDFAAITGGVLFGLNDVLTEVTVSEVGGTTEYLSMVGVFGFLISFLQSLLLEREEILQFFPGDQGFDSGNGDTEMCSTSSGFLLLFAFVGVTICSYIGGSHFLILSEAAFFNLSLLTGDLWSVLFSVVAERIVPQPLFFAALVAVLSGVVVYEMAPSPAFEKHHQMNWVFVSNNGKQEGSEHHRNGDRNGVDGTIVVENRHRIGQPQHSDFDSDGFSDEFDVGGVELKNMTIT